MLRQGAGKMVFAIAALAALATGGAEPLRPRFADYALYESYRGKTARPRFVLDSERRAAELIRRGAEGPPNFAGHYRVITWECGTECIEAILMDVRTGRILHLPVTVRPTLRADGDALEMTCTRVEGYAGPGEPLEGRLNSRLLIARSCLADGDLAAHYLVIETNGRLRTLMREVIRIPRKRR